MKLVTLDGTDGESANPHYASTSKEDPGFYSTVDETKKEGVSSTITLWGNTVKWKAR